jgi:hypothetical protein
MQVAPNLADDQDLMAEASPGLTKLWTDSGFTGLKADRALAQYEIEQVPTARRGEAGVEGKLVWQDFTRQFDAARGPVAVMCPGGQSVTVPAHERPRRSCVFDQATCRQ